MLTANQELWLQALESGEFNQTRSKLQRGDFFCCLGVACKVAEKAGVEVQYANDTDLFGSTLGGQLPVLDWLGLRTICGSPDEDMFLNDLTTMNDNRRPFKEIAAIVRKNSEKYFVNREPGTLAPSLGVG